MPDVRYAPRPWPAYFVTYDDARADDMGAVVAETWDRTDECVVLLCLRCDVAWRPGGPPPPCEHLTLVAEARREAHL